MEFLFGLFRKRRREQPTQTLSLEQKQLIELRNRQLEDRWVSTTQKSVPSNRTVPGILPRGGGADPISDVNKIKPPLPKGKGGSTG